MQLLWFYYSEGSLDKGCTFPGLCHRSKVGSEAKSGKWGWVFRAQGNVGVYWCRSSRSSYLLCVFLVCLQKVSPQYLATLLPWTVQWFVLHGESLTMCALCYIAKLLCRLVARLHDSIRMKMSSAGSSSDSTIQSGMSAISLDRGCRIIPLCSADLSANQPEVTFCHTKSAPTTS